MATLEHIEPLDIIGTHSCPACCAKAGFKLDSDIDTAKSEKDRETESFLQWIIFCSLGALGAISILRHIPYSVADMFPSQWMLFCEWVVMVALIVVGWFGFKTTFEQLRA